MNASIHLTAAVCAGAPGVGLTALFGACQAQLSSLRRDDVLSVPGPDGEFEPVLIAPCDWISADEPAGRLTMLLGSALQQMPLTADGPVLCEILLPPPATVRGTYLDLEVLRDELLALFPALLGVELALTPAEGGAIARLRARLDELAAGRWNAVIFGGADSLVDAPSVLELAQAGRVLTDSSGHGLAPGEGAALLRFTRESAPGALRVAGIVSAQEPHPGQAEHRRLNALQDCVTQALAQARLGADQAATVWLDLEAEADRGLEWYQVRRSLWQPRLEGDVHHAVELGLIETPEPEPVGPAPRRAHRSLGELGAAALPMQLALAYGEHGYARRWQAFGLAEPGPALVLEAGADAPRGAVCLRPAV